MNIQDIRDYFESEEGKNKAKEYFLKLKMRQEIELKQIERLHQSNKFNEFTQKVCDKYNSKEYSDKWYKRGIMPPCNLDWFLLSYAKKYGRKCTKAEWEKHANPFTSELYFIENWYFKVMHGQGSIVQIYKDQ